MKKNARFSTLAFTLLGLACWAFSPAQAFGGNAAITQGVNQSNKITGQVVDETGEPMIGVTVVVKGTQIAAVTDLDGNFNLNVPNGKATIELTYIGYKATTVEATDRKSVV